MVAQTMSQMKNTKKGFFPLPNFDIKKRILERKNYSDMNKNIWVWKFNNGYGCSVISDGYGREEGLFELAIIKFIDEDHYAICCDTPITSDVIGYLNHKEVNKLLEQVSKLPQTKNNLNKND